MRKYLTAIVAVVGLGWVVVAGCSQNKPAAHAPAEPSDQGKSFILASEPAGVRNVNEVVATAKDQEEVTVIGRIGGDEKPWDEGVASFRIADVSLVPCNEREGDTCPIPWDYCCDLPLLKTHTIAVAFTDAAGQPLDADARALFGLRELQTVVIRGKLHRQDGAQKIIAEKIFVRR